MKDHKGDEINFVGVKKTVEHLVNDLELNKDLATRLCMGQIEAERKKAAVQTMAGAACLISLVALAGFIAYLVLS